MSDEHDDVRLTRRQASIIGVYTGISFGPFSDIHGLAEQLLRRPIWTHEFARPEIWAELREAARPQMLAIAAEDGASL